MTAIAEIVVDTVVETMIKLVIFAGNLVALAFIVIAQFFSGKRKNPIQ